MLTKRKIKKRNMSIKNLFSEIKKRHISVTRINRHYAEISWNSE